MDRKIALEKIKERFEEEKPLLQQKFLECLNEREQELLTELYEGIKQLNPEYPIRVLQFQLMRTDIYQGHSYITLCGYNADWYLDEERTEYQIDADYLYQPFQELEDSMKKEISVYMGGVTVYDIKNLICEYFLECFINMADRMLNNFYLFDEWTQENQISFALPYRIVWGEYRGRAKTIFYLDKAGKTKEEIQKELEDNKEKEAYLFCSWTESDLADITLKQNNFGHLNMKNSRLSRVTFDKCMFLGAGFKNSFMEWCSFEQSILNGCNFNELQAYQLDFSSAQISNCSFEQSKLRKGKFDKAVLTDVIFTEGNLSECSFRNARLCRVDLRTENLSNIDFIGAELEQVYIHVKNYDEITLTPEQESQVYILEEEVHELL